MTIPLTLFYVQISLKINFSKKYEYSCNKSQSKRQIELMSLKKHVNQWYFFVSSLQNGTALYPSTNLILNVITVKFRLNRNSQSNKSL